MDELGELRRLAPPGWTEAQLNDFLEEAFREFGIRQKAQRSADMSLADFTSRFWKGYVHMAYQAAIDDVLTQIAAYVLSGGAVGISRAMIFAPPRHGKTKKVSRIFPAWMYSQNPALKIITASYGSGLAYANSRAVRNLIDSPAYRQSFPNVALAGKRVDHWGTGAGGEFLAAGALGSVVGHGAGLIILDDVVKSRAEAESATIRQRMREWYADDILTRGEEPGFALLIMQTRYHTDDLPGWLLSDENEDDTPWHILSLPALAEEGDVLGRLPGEALWEARYPTSWLEKRRAAMGEYSFASLYQQRPIPRGDGLFDTALFSILETAPPCKQIVRFYDLAVSAKTRANYSVGLKLGVTADEMFVILDVWRKQLSPADIAAAIRQNALIDGPSVRIRLEADNHSRAQLDFILRDPDMRPYTIDIKTPEGDKYTRAGQPASRANAGKFALLRAAWNRVFLDELSVFPAGKNDDQVDALSGGYSMLAENPKSNAPRRVEFRGLYPTLDEAKRRNRLSFYDRNRR